MKKIEHENGIEEYILSDDNVEVSILNIGASIYKLVTPDADGNKEDIVLGYDSPETYIENPDFFGCFTGRFGNRIANASFELNGQKYLVSANEGSNCLHGGVNGLNKKIFDCEVLSDTSLKFSCNSPDGESGFPGHLTSSVIYTLEDNSLKMTYEAQSDADTIINLTNHSYFNLAGHSSGSILEHEIKIEAEEFLPVDESMIPEEPHKVGGTPFDLRITKPIATGLRTPYPQIQRCGGYDHNYILSDSNTLKFAARVEHPFTGRTLECWTTEPGVQLYTANHIDGMDGKEGAYYGKFPAFCLETQHYPDSPNRPEFPNTVLKSGDIYKSETIYKFGTLNDN